MTIFNRLLTPITYPLSLIYGMGVSMRNNAFDQGWIKSKSYDIPIIAVGNLSVGGTGKTPHIEYLVTLLKPLFKVAVISRGYKRQSTGMQISRPDSTPNQLGDEPFQIFNKNRDITVIAHDDRCEATEYLLKQEVKPDVILLDDAFQHRYIKAGLYILLTDFNHPFFHDRMMPLGRLREPAHNRYRADIIIVSKTPKNVVPAEINRYTEMIDAKNQQGLYFSALQNDTCRHFITQQEANLDPKTQVILVTGIAQPELVLEKISNQYELMEHIVFPDHHNFTSDDLKKITTKFNSLENSNKAIIVTEKDAVKLAQLPNLDEKIKECIYYLPLEVVFLQNQSNLFNQSIIDYVTENKRNS